MNAITERNYKMLGMCLKNDLRGCNIFPMDDFYGYMIYAVALDTDPIAAVYVIPSGGYSVYDVEIDRRKGTDIIDETKLAECETHFQAVNTIKKHHQKLIKEYDGTNVYKIADPIYMADFTTHYWA